MGNLFVSDLVDGAAYPSRALQMIQKWEEWLMHERIVLTFRGLDGL